MPRKLQTAIDLAHLVAIILPLIQNLRNSYRSTTRESDLARRIREYHTDASDDHEPNGNGY